MYLYVYDSLDAYTYVSKTIKVTKRDNINYKDLFISLSKIDIGSDTSNISPIEMKYEAQLINTMTAAINTINCTLPKNINCNDLNRNECSNTEHTCGSCLDDYIGEDGDANSPCISISNNIVIEHNKECPNACSGNGQCIFYKSSFDEEKIPNCYISNINCVAKCVCDNDYGGNDCAKTLDEIQESKEIRKNLLNTFIFLNRPDTSTNNNGNSNNGNNGNSNNGNNNNNNDAGGGNQYYDPTDKSTIEASINGLETFTTKQDELDDDTANILISFAFDKIEEMKNLVSSTNNAITFTSDIILKSIDAIGYTLSDRQNALITNNRRSLSTTNITQTACDIRTSYDMYINQLMNEVVALQDPINIIKSYGLRVATSKLDLNIYNSSIGINNARTDLEKYTNGKDSGSKVREISNTFINNPTSFTLGLSLCCPSYCHSLAEKKLNDDLYDISLNSRYYDRNINFSLYKKWFQSYIVIEIPETLFSKDYISSDGDDIEGGSNSSVNSTSNISSVVDLNMSSIDNSDTKTE